MDSSKFVLKATRNVALGQLLCTGLITSLFALLGNFDATVWRGCLVGGILATGNFFFMAISASVASGKAVAQDVKGGQATMRLSYAVRLTVIFAIMFALVKSGACNMVTVTLPLCLTRPILFVIEFFRKTGEVKT